MLKKQSGSVLIVSLIIVIALTLLVLSSTQSTLIQEKMTSSMMDMNISLEVTESGVTDAEATIDSLVDLSGFSNAGNDGRYSEGNGPVDLFDETIWTDALTLDATTSISNLTATYFIEHLGILPVSVDEDNLNIEGYEKNTADIGDVDGFKIVSRLADTDGNTKRIIVSYYGRQF